MTPKTPTVPDSAAMWTGTTTNRKTGNVPSLWVGSTRAESFDSCKGCPMLEDRSCYAQFGTPMQGHGSMIRAASKGKSYSLRAALMGSKRSAKMARFGAIGDPGALSMAYLRKAIRAVRSVGLDVVGYTHHWRGRPDLAGVFMASCDSMAEVDSAMAAGYRAAVVLPWDHTERRFTTPNGARGVVCPAMLSDRVTCNDCRLCDGSKPGPVIGFPNHGPQVRVKRAALKTTPKPKHGLDALDI